MSFSYTCVQYGDETVTVCEADGVEMRAVWTQEQTLRTDLLGVNFIYSIQTKAKNGSDFNYTKPKLVKLTRNMQLDTVN